jgi:membrane protein YqaA with SNARE-associated domain
MSQIESMVVQWLSQVVRTIGWPGIVVLMALESANIPIPSELVMPLAGWVLVQAPGLAAWQAVILGGVYGAVGCTLGSVLSYWLGSRGGRWLLRRRGSWIMADLYLLPCWYGTVEPAPLCGAHLRWVLSLVCPVVAGWLPLGQRLASGQRPDTPSGDTTQRGNPGGDWLLRLVAHP